MSWFSNILDKCPVTLLVLLHSWVFNIFDMFQSFALILTDVQRVPSLDNGSLFKLVSECF